MPPDIAVVPPTIPLFSRMTTSPAPKSCAALAAVMAAPPEPRMTTSASRSHFTSSVTARLPGNQILPASMERVTRRQPIAEMHGRHAIVRPAQVPFDPVDQPGMIGDQLLQACPRDK